MIMSKSLLKKCWSSRLKHGLFARSVSSWLPSTDLNAKHLKEGDSCPPLDPSKLTFFNMRFCPYAQRAVLVLLAKEIEFDNVNIFLKKRPDWIREKNPLGKVPILQFDGDKILYESLVVSDYLDEIYPDRYPLHPKDPFMKARDQMLTYRFEDVTTGFYKLAFSLNNPDVEKTKMYNEKFRANLDVFENVLKNERGTKYFGGNEKPAMVDFMIWPWFERFSLMKVVFPEAQMTIERYPKLLEWMESMKEVPAVKSYLIDEVDHLKFFMTLASGDPDYDILRDKE